MNKRILINNAELCDAEALLNLQRLAFRTEAELYDDWQIAPLTESLDTLLAELKKNVVIKAIHRDSERLVGSVRARLEGEVCYIGRLSVHPDFRNYGIGTVLMNEIEGRFPVAKRFELFTGYRSFGNLRLYARLGYIRHEEHQVSEKLRLVLLKKVVD